MGILSRYRFPDMGGLPAPCITLSQIYTIYIYIYPGHKIFKHGKCRFLIRSPVS